MHVQLWNGSWMLRVNKCELCATVLEMGLISLLAQLRGIETKFTQASVLTQS